jgi:hypothetical protein
MPILNLARTMPMMRTILRPIAFFLMAVHMLDTGTHLRAPRVGGLLRLRKRTTADPAPVDAALQALGCKPRLDLRRTVGAVGPDLLAGVGLDKELLKLLAVWTLASVASHLRMILCDLPTPMWFL